MMNVEYHEGSFYTYLSVFCREGYRAGCEVCLKSRLYPQKEASQDRIIEVRKSPETAAKKMRMLI
jgi:hypothetical protein